METDTTNPWSTFRSGTILSGLRDIRTWLLIAFALRLIGITLPPLETSHHWRQTTVTMVARNFAETGIDLLHPRMDTAGELTGITGMEFPLLNALIAGCIHAFGPAHWYGRLIVLLFGTLGVLAFHGLVERHLGERTAFHAAMLLLFSLWFMYSRKIMPDVFALSLVIMGVERMDAALCGKRAIRWVAVGALLILLGTLSKITAGCLLAAWPVIAWQRKCGWVATAAIGVACLPAVWWYFRWVPHLVETYGYWHFFMGKAMVAGAKELLAHPLRTMDNFYFDALRFSGFACYCLGLIVVVRVRNKALMALFMLTTLAFLVIMLKAGDTFWVHAYYVLPFIPIMALFGGVGLAHVKDQRWAFALLALVVIEGLLAQKNDFHMNPDLAPLLGLEQDLQQTGVDGLIVVNSGEVPTPLYFAHQKGWTLSNVVIQRTGTLDSLATLGCTRVVVMKHTFEGDVHLPWPDVLERPAYRILAKP